MSYETARRRVRPLPPTPVACSAVASPSSFYRSPSPQNSLFTVASTILPEYSSVLGNGAEITWDEDDGSLMLTHEPPRYSYVLPSHTRSTSNSLAPNSGEASGPRTSSRVRPSFIERKLHLKKGYDNPWATLKLISRGPLPNSKSKALRFIGGDSVRGVLELNLDSPISVHSLKLKLEGRVVTVNEETSFIEGAQEDYTIMNYQHVLYSKKTHPNPGSFGDCSFSRSRKPDGKMHGTYRFPFTFHFPLTTGIGIGRDRTLTSTYDLPPSFSESHSEIRMRYDLTLIVEHGFLKKDSKTSTDIVYMPKIVAPPVSIARLMAYENGSIFPGPRDDPDGWHESPSASFLGKYHGREAHIICNLWVAKPLCYTRGTVIPCYLALLGSDTRSLEHLSSPQAIRVQLTRHVYFGGNGVSTSNKPREDRRKELRCVGTAIWWEPLNSSQHEDPNRCWLEGEIHLPQDLHSSCHHPRFSIEYYVEMMPFISVDFINLEDSHQYPKVRQRVEIATFHQYGPMPRPLTRKDENDCHSRLRPRMLKREEHELTEPKFPSSVFQFYKGGQPGEFPFR